MLNHNIRVRAVIHWGLRNTAVKVVVPEDYQTVMGLVREALAKAQLRVVGEVDLSHSLRAGLGLHTEPHAILLVDSPVLLLEALVLDPGLALRVPVHVAISDHGHETWVHYPDRSACHNMLPALAAPVLKLLTRLQQAISTLEPTEF